MAYSTQNDLLLAKLMEFYELDNNLTYMLSIINGQSKISLRIIDWFVTNYAKKNYTVYTVHRSGEEIRFKVYIDYKLKLKAYSKEFFDSFCRWERITIPYINGTHIQTTLGQLNFFKWALQNDIIKYIEENYAAIDEDMNTRNSSAKNKSSTASSSSSSSSNDETVVVTNKTRKKREELSANASRSMKKENIPTVLVF